MKIETTKERLDAAIGKVVRAVTKQGTLPVLGCILFEAKDGTLTLKATNLDLGVEAVVPVKMSAPGIVAVPGPLVQSVVSGLPPESSVTLTLLGGNVSVKAGNRVAVLKAVAHEDFPVIPRVEKTGTMLTVPASDLVAGFRSVWYCASPSGLKPELSSVLMSFIDGELVFAATDAFRLAERRIRPAGDFGEALFGPVLIPFKNAGEIMRLFDGLTGNITLAVDGSQVGIFHDACYVTSRIVDGMFPDYRQIIPEKYATEATMLKGEILNALKGVTLFADTFHQVRIKVTPTEKRFVMTTKNDAVGESVEVVEARIMGDDTEAGFNYRYLLDCFQSIFDESVVFRFAGSGKPLTVQGIKDTSFLYLVMPMNI